MSFVVARRDGQTTGNVPSSPGHRAEFLALPAEFSAP